ncbi:hypothetical protein HNP25_001253 [Arcicella rosea]|uniref:Uncharacterized protein n=1 Tax=Arcicella rosea TaxID=502909 RepID=A0A841ET24_9BACT|nr:hypothetical protein [Arcicella rosea]
MYVNDYIKSKCFLYILQIHDEKHLINPYPTKYWFTVLFFLKRPEWFGLLCEKHLKKIDMII